MLKGSIEGIVTRDAKAREHFWYIGHCDECSWQTEYALKPSYATDYLREHFNEWHEGEAIIVGAQ